MDIAWSDIGGAVWQFERARQPGGGCALWVTGVHWPGCDDSAGHGPCSLGEVRSDRQFRIANQKFWKTIYGEDLTGLNAVFDAAERFMIDGDPGDVPNACNASETEREV